MRYLRWLTGKRPTRYIAQYHMNEATQAQRERFIARVRREMLALYGESRPARSGASPRSAP
jgi:hypothetical protein